MEKIVRTVCQFTKNPGEEKVERLNQLVEKLTKRNFQVQTKRICSPDHGFQELEKEVGNSDFLLSVGELNFDQTKDKLDDFLQSQGVSFNFDLSKDEITDDHVELLFQIIKKSPGHTFNFTYGFGLPDSSPYYPSAKFGKEGFAVGLQPINLSKDCKTIEDWLERTKVVWEEMVDIFSDEDDFLGIDSSVAPLFDDASLVGMIEKFGQDFSTSALSDSYLKITNFIKSQNPKPIGLCGIMFPCLEDSGLAEEYEKGNFSIERNLFLSLHSGLGIDTYPIGVDEKPEKILNILRLTQGLSRKYQKPLSARFVSDGKSKIGEKSDFQNQYLKDVILSEL